jgi:hypothetical protein
VIVSAAEPGVAASAGIGASGAAAAATATAVALPVYGATVFGINMHNKAAIKKDPRSLTLRWTGRLGEGDTSLELHFLEGLHVEGNPQ